MENKTRTLIALALAGILSACCLSSCGRNNMDNEQDSMENPSEIVSDVADDIMPDAENGKTVEENSDEYTADEKGDRSSMPERFFGGK